MHDELRQAGITVFERGWLSSNNVLIHGGTFSDAVLVDTGYWTHGPQTLELLRHALDGAPLKGVVNTHLHSDHCGGNSAIQQAYTNCALVVPSGEAVAVDEWDEDRLSFRATGQHCPRFERTACIAAGDLLDIGRWQWEAIASPGHDPMSLALYQPDLQVLVSADALWENGFGVIFPELEGEPGFDDVAATLDAYERLKVRWVIPGHGRIFTDMHEALARARRRLDGFISDPRKHAVHAAKVLVKFHMLEWQAKPIAALLQWALQTPLIVAIHGGHFADTNAEQWVLALVSDLCRATALRRDEDTVFNC